MQFEAEPPARFGKFELLRRLGSGGMAEVFLAQMTGTDGFAKMVALKRILPHLSAVDDFSQSFISEARLGGSLNHPHIVQTLELGREAGFLYLAMEYVEGMTLAAFLKSRRELGAPIPLPLCLEIIRQVIEALSYAHTACDIQGRQLNMIHRDLKPDNVLMSLFGVAKLADFGVAKASSNLNQTANPNLVKGTVAYMSPEQALGEPLDARSDLYSVGALLFELLTLDLLYPTAFGLPGLMIVSKGDISDRLPLIANQPQAVQQLVVALLEKERHKRYQSAWDVRKALLEIAAAWPLLGMDLASEVRTAHAHAQASRQEGAFQMVFTGSSPHDAATVSTPSIRAQPYTLPSASTGAVSEATSTPGSASRGSQEVPLIPSQVGDGQGPAVTLSHGGASLATGHRATGSQAQFHTPTVMTPSASIVSRPSQREDLEATRQLTPLPPLQSAPTVVDGSGVTAAAPSAQLSWVEQETGPVRKSDLGLRDSFPHPAEPHRPASSPDLERTVLMGPQGQGAPAHSLGLSAGVAPRPVPATPPVQAAPRKLLLPALLGGGVLVLGGGLLLYLAMNDGGSEETNVPKPPPVSTPIPKPVPIAQGTGDLGTASSPAPASVATPLPQPKPSPPPDMPPKPQPPLVTETAKTSVKKPPLPSDCQGLLRANARPSADVFLDGKPLGETPIVDRKLTCGRHRLKFVTEDGREQTQNVTVVADETQKVIVEFDP